MTRRRALLGLIAVTAMAMSPLAAATASPENIVSSVAVSGRPSDLALSPDGTRLWAGWSPGGTVVAIDVRTSQVQQTIAVGQYVWDLAASPDGRSVWVANGGDPLVVDATSGAVIGSVPVGCCRSYGVALSPDGRKAWVTSAASGSLKVVDAAARTVTGSVAMSGEPWGVDVSPDGARVYVTDQNGGRLQAVDAIGGVLVGSVSVGKNPGPVEVSPDGRTVWVANQGSGTVSEIDAATLSVLSTIAVGPFPLDLAVSGDGRKVWVTTRQGLESIDTSTRDVDVLPVAPAYAVAAAPNPRQVWVSSDGLISLVDTSQKPGAPVAVRALLRQGSAVVTWQAPADTGDSTISRYVVTSTPDSRTCETRDQLSCEVRGLANGRRYSFRVTAFNDAGAGPASSASTTALLAAAPGKPVAVAVRVAPASATVTWKAPKTDGGSPIQRYIVRASPSGRTCVARAVRQCQITGLKSGQEYAFSVQAENRKGAGIAATTSARRIPWPPAPVPVQPAPGPTPVPTPKPSQDLS